MDNENKSFQYTYSAKEQAELKRIREKYEDHGEEKLDRLRRLDGSATKKALATALISGCLGALIMGFGMSLVLTELGEVLGMAPKLVMIPGVVIGIVGMIPVALAYPIWRLTLKKQRKKIAPEILRLTDELMK